MNLLNRAMLLLSFTLFLSDAMAATQVPLGKTIERIFVYRNMTVIEYSPSFPSAANECPEASGTNRERYAAVVNPADTGKRISAALWMAYVTKQSVGFGVSGCNAWGGGIPNIYRVDIIPPPQ